MAKGKSKSRAHDTGPAQPSWRQPPARSRKKLRQMRSTTAPPTKSTRPTSAGSKSEKAVPAFARQGQPPLARLRLPAQEDALAIARRILMLALTIGLTLGLIQLLRLPQLTVSATSTQIGSVQRVTPQQVYEASGIEGRSIFLVRPDSIAAAVSRLDGVAEAQVHVRLPNQVLIDVQERAPLVAWQASQGGTVMTTWLTADGEVVPQTGQVPPLTLHDQTDELPDAESPRTSMLLKNLAALHDARPDIAEAIYGKSEGLSFRTPEGWDVWLGDGDQLADKLALLAVASQEISKLGGQAQVIDLRYSNERAIWW